MTEQPTQFKDGYLLAAILQTDGVLSNVQRELKQVYPDLQLTLEQIRELIRSAALRPEVLSGSGIERANDLLNQAHSEPARSEAADQAANLEGSKPNRPVHVTGTYKAVPPKDDGESDLWHDKMMSTGGG